MTLSVASTSRQLRPRLVAVVILGRQQLYTASTLPASLPVLARGNSPTRLACLRLWGIGLGANLLGTVLFACAISQDGIFRPRAFGSMIEISRACVAGRFFISFSTNAAKTFVK
jgi:formate/nitrite transporter FocA (FNT family)